MAVKTFQEQFITDRAGRKTHVILPLEVYERVRALLDDSDLQIAETYAAQECVAAADRDTPDMDVYNAL